MSERNEVFTVVTRRSRIWFFVMIGVFGLIYLSSLLPVVLSGTGVLDRNQSDRLEAFYDRLREGPWVAMSLMGIILIFIGLFIAYMRPRRRELVWLGDRFLIEGREYNLPDSPVRPGRWIHIYAGTQGSLLELFDSSGKRYFLGLRDFLFESSQYGTLTAEDCSFYFETKKQSSLFIELLKEMGIVDLTETPADARDPLASSIDRNRISLTLTRSPSGWKTWIPLYIGFFVGIYGLVGLAMALRKFFQLSDGASYAITLIGAFGLIVTAVFYGTKRLRNRDLRLEIDSEHLTVKNITGRELAHHRLGELHFNTPAWVSRSRHGRTFYVGPQLDVVRGNKSLFRIGTMKPEYQWVEPTKSVSSCDYLLGPPEWLAVVQRLGLNGRIIDQDDLRQE